MVLLALERPQPAEAKVPAGAKSAKTKLWAQRALFLTSNRLGYRGDFETKSTRPFNALK